MACALLAAPVQPPGSSAGQVEQVRQCSCEETQPLDLLGVECCFWPRALCQHKTRWLHLPWQI